MTRGIFDPDQPDRAPPDLAAGRRDPKELSDGGHLGSRADHDRIGHRNVVSFECHALAAFAVGTRDHLLLGGDHVAPGLDQVGRIIRRATSYPLVQPGTPGLAEPGCQGPPGNEAIGPGRPDADGTQPSACACAGQEGWLLAAEATVWHEPDHGNRRE